MRDFQAFWDYFSEHGETFYHLQSLPDSENAYYFNTLTSLLEAIGPTLSCVMKFASKERTYAELVLTTHGRAEGVILIRNLMQVAPVIPNWKITAFIQPVIDVDAIADRTDPPYQFEGLTLKASDIVWMPDSYDDKTDKHCLLFGFTNLASTLMSYPLETVTDYVLWILMDFLGELVVCQKISGFEFYFSKPNMDDGWLGLEDLPVYLDGGW
ncbi:hypothetical protein C1T31_13505 [Hanstruepera neustonica]|uniref:DUF695 domain-containing protein n=1 Tax=Hanstruepera neustonica TaxID=1445657 RepID=A0A2K1DVP5_9FLAO|nr:hypothetical protein [Hanstruepera neustonica]PNQ72115.1 hypothetical protein C1T31_13505 [Hanstruepera neustonica]